MQRSSVFGECRRACNIARGVGAHTERDSLHASEDSERFGRPRLISSSRDLLLPRSRHRLHGRQLIIGIAAAALTHTRYDEACCRSSGAAGHPGAACCEPSNDAGNAGCG